MFLETFATLQSSICQFTGVEALQGLSNRLLLCSSGAKGSWSHPRPVGIARIKNKMAVTYQVSAIIAYFLVQRRD